MNWKPAFDKELARGQQAREEGNEGMARVCARRAAGIVVRAYFQKRGLPMEGRNVLRHLRILSESEDEPEDVREVAGHFFLRITPDHDLPEDVDLLADVVWLRETLMAGV